MQNLKKGPHPGSPILRSSIPTPGLLSACGPIMIHSFPGTGRRRRTFMDIGAGAGITPSTGAHRFMEEDIESAAAGWFRVKDIPGFIRAALHSPAMLNRAEAPERLAGEPVQVLPVRDPIPQGVIPVGAIPEARAAEAPEDPEAVLQAHRPEDTAAAVAVAVQRVRANPTQLHY